MCVDERVPKMDVDERFPHMYVDERGFLTCMWMREGSSYVFG